MTNNDNPYAEDLQKPEDVCSNKEADRSDWHKTLYKEREILIDEYREASRSFDQNMLTLSAGAIGLSITFIKLLSPTIKLDSLVLAWTFFIVSLLLTLLSFLTSQSSCRKQMNNVDYLINEDTKTRCGLGKLVNLLSKKRPCEECHDKNCWSNITMALNFLIIIFFILGVISFAVFAKHSLTNNSKNNKKEVTTMSNVKPTPPSRPTPTPRPSSHETAGFIPPSPPPPPTPKK